MNDTMKMIFTLKSGKSIVMHMYKEQCFNIFKKITEYNINDDTKSNKIMLYKKNNNDDIAEAVVIFMSDLAALQINEPDDKSRNRIVDIYDVE